MCNVSLGSRRIGRLKQREWCLRWAEKTGTGFALPGHRQAVAEASNGKPGKLLEFRKVG